jgi:hypothetical protein
VYHAQQPCRCCCCCSSNTLLHRFYVAQTARIPDAALLHVNYANLVEGLLPYSVAVDEARHCVVLAIRGSLSVEDCVTGGCNTSNCGWVAASVRVHCRASLLAVSA